ncbi:MAG TPA: exodeoxyribonuclease VII small subunit [Candidatus Binatia bacterium]|jgi:exodeoxyribonuclease VII small subunit|nr:exodeoxyribonuclease VII small subunit [Candidatus Binatia bacterium]
MAKSLKNYNLLSAELEAVLVALQSPDTDIDQALELYERGQKVLAELELYLKTTENKILKIKPNLNQGKTTV